MSVNTNIPVRFPLYKDDGKAIVGLSREQRRVLEKLRLKIKNKEYKTLQNKCICGSEQNSNDVVISEKDRYGLPFPQILCSYCGVIWSQLVFDEKSNLSFYETEQKPLYVGKEIPGQEYFDKQVIRGEKLKKLWLSKTSLNEFNTVFDIGCGAGGIVSTFKEFKTISGCDFNKKYLSLGRDNGVNVNYGDFKLLINDNSQNLIVLSHVFEHLLDPIGMAKDIVKKLKIGGELLIDVPGIYSIRDIYGSPLHYFQNAHVYNFSKININMIFEAIGCEVIHSDESVVALIKRVREVNMDGLSPNLNVQKSEVKSIEEEIIKMHMVYQYTFNTKRIKNKIKKILIDFGWL